MTGMVRLRAWRRVRRGGGRLSSNVGRGGAACPLWRRSVRRSAHRRARGPGAYAGQCGACTPVSAVTTGSSAWLISSPMERKKVMGAP
ncbi:hypothetical protein AMK24_00510 [Streptomyces sp. CB02366]|nr:hypothetical protein AMK24_00510 [Streptomyces sp. CB02366]